jgi:alditol oxidase
VGCRDGSSTAGRRDRGDARRGRDVKGTIGTNWAGNLRYRARRLHEPTSIEDVRRLLPGLRRARVLGSRHSFNDLADTDGDLISLARLPRQVRIDPVARAVTVDGGARYGDVCATLERAGFALHALASLPHISVAGATATATHGSGDGTTSLASAVVGLDLVTADGDMVHIDAARDPGRLEGATVSLGALGAVVSLTLAIEPSYRMRQDVYEGLTIEAFTDHVDTITHSCDSASFFTTWAPGEGFHQVWLKRRVDGATPTSVVGSLFGARLAERPVHPIRGMPPEACTTQLGVPGPWHQRAPHFRFEDPPSAGAELQSEYFIARADAPAAVLALSTLGERLAPIVLASEIRTVAADDLWLSPAYHRASATIHFTWIPDPAAVRAVLPFVEAALAPFEPRPHWAKVSGIPPATIRSAYDRLPAFEALARDVDPKGVFRNQYLDRLLS